MRRTLLMLISLLLLPQLAPGQEESSLLFSGDFAAGCLLSAASVAACLLDPAGSDVPEGLNPEGIYIWSQPGAGLVAQYFPLGFPPRDELHYSREQLRGFLRELPTAQAGEPLLYPTEEQYEAGLPLPTVYVIDSAQARERLGHYMDGFDTWSRLMSEDGEPLDWRIKPELLLEPEGAVVYVTPDGLLEFYFSMDSEGRAELTNLIWYEFFSA